jgi:hypothetical protein
LKIDCKVYIIKSDHCICIDNFSSSNCLLCLRYFPDVFLCQFCQQREMDKNIICDDIFDNESTVNEDEDSNSENDNSFILDEAEECESSSDQSTESDFEENEFYFS